MTPCLLTDSSRICATELWLGAKIALPDPRQRLFRSAERGDLDGLIEVLSSGLVDVNATGIVSANRTSYSIRARFLMFVVSSLQHTGADAVVSGD